MSIRDLEQSKEMRERFDLIGGREGVAKRVIQLCERVAKNKNYKEAINVMGRMARLVQVCKADSYWDEKAMHGKEAEWYAVKQAVEHNGDFTKAIDSGDFLKQSEVEQ